MKEKSTNNYKIIGDKKRSSFVIKANSKKKDIRPIARTRHCGGCSRTRK